MRKEYELSQEQFDTLLKQMQPVPYIVVGGIAPRSQQERANDAWCALGREMGFDGMTVRPGKSEKFFTAEAIDAAVSAQQGSPRGFRPEF